MADEYKGMFNKVPLKEAYDRATNYNNRLKALREKGANPLGKKAIDVEYKKLATEAINYSMQFSLEELYAMVGYEIFGDRAEADVREDLSRGLCGLEAKVNR